MIVTGKEKAFLGGMGAGISTFAGQLSVGGKLDVKTVAWSLGAWLATHLFVYYATNTTVEAPADAVVSPASPATPATPGEPTPPAAPSA